MEDVMAKLIMAYPGKYLVVSALAALLMFAGTPGWAAIERSPATADHTKFKSLKGPFENASEVTEACLECHTEAAGQIKETTHWTWLYQRSEERRVGKEGRSRGSGDQER